MDHTSIVSTVILSLVILVILLFGIRSMITPGHYRLLWGRGECENHLSSGSGSVSLSLLLPAWDRGYELPKLCKPHSKCLS